MNGLLIVLDDPDGELVRQSAIAQRLAAEGTTFPQFIITTPVCGPSRVSILTGFYARHHGATSNEGAFARSQEIDDTFLPKHLPDHRTGLIGKYLNGYQPPYVPPGWDRWFGKHKRGYFNWEAFNGTAIRSFGTAASDYATDALCDRAEGFIQGPEPWFLLLALNAPHGPLEVAPRHAGVVTPAAPRPPSFNEADVSDKPPALQRPLLTDDQIAQIDADYQARGRMMTTVSERLDTILDMVSPDTLVILCADNGYTVGVHRRPSGKGVAWEESITVPLYVRGPGFTPGLVDPMLIANIDVGPFIIDRLGGQPWIGRDGNAFLGHDEVLIESTSMADDQFAGIRTASQVYVEYLDGGREFYDLTTDPYQLDNAVETADPAVIAEMQRRLGYYR